MRQPENVVVIGAGVSGLTTALVLAQSKRYNVTVIAKYLPGDEAADYTSPWAGANFLSASEKGSRVAQWEETTFYHLWALAQDEAETGVQITPAILWNRSEDISFSRGWPRGPDGPNPWFKSLMPAFRILDPDELPPGIKSGTEFQTVCIDVPHYLNYLSKQLTYHGVQIRRATIDHVTDAVSFHQSSSPVSLIVNCSGLMASTLGGVEDDQVFPARGQMCLVRNKVAGIYTTNTVTNVPFDMMYLIPRGRDHTLIGGSYKEGSWDSKPDPELRKRMLKRAVDLYPKLGDGKGVEGLNVVRDIVGLRPARHGGVRLERQKYSSAWVVHNYGHGGIGYQSSYGCAQNVLRLLDEIVSSNGNSVNHE